MEATLFPSIALVWALQTLPDREVPTRHHSKCFLSSKTRPTSLDLPTLPLSPVDLVQLRVANRPINLVRRNGDNPSKLSRGEIMLRRAILVAAIAFVASVSTASVSEAQQPGQQQAYGRSWGGAASSRDYSRFNHYPYVYYPQNFYGNEYYRSSDSLYHRYVPEMQIPVYNRQWYNDYPTNRRYHWGHHYLTDVF